MRVDPIQASIPDLVRPSTNIDGSSSSPEHQLQQPEADATVLAAVSVEFERQGHSAERDSHHTEISYDDGGKAVVRVMRDDDGELLFQMPTEQVLGVAEEIEERIEEERTLDLRS